MNNILVYCNVSTKTFLDSTIHEDTLVRIYEEYCRTYGLKTHYNKNASHETKARIARMSFEELVRFTQDNYRLALIQRN